MSANPATIARARVLLEFVVYGVPGPQGSKAFKGTFRGKDGRTHAKLVESSTKVKPWREAVKWAAREVIANPDAFTRFVLGPCGDFRVLAFPLDGPLRVRLTFTLPKPKSAPKTRVTYPDRKPDGSKLQRSTEDALTDAGLWADDARVVEWIGAKRFPNEGDGALDAPGVRIVVEVIA